MGNKVSGGVSSNDEKDELSKISEPQMEQARVVWTNYIKDRPHFFADVLKAIIKKSETIGQVFGLRDTATQTNGEKKIVTRFSKNLIQFIQNILETNDWSKAEIIAEQCGGRHIYYGERRFQPIYWDVFVLAITEVLEQIRAEHEESEKNCDKGPSPAQIYAWQKFLLRVVENMFRGYNRALEERRKTEDTSGSSKSNNDQVKSEIVDSSPPKVTDL